MPLTRTEAFTFVDKLDTMAEADAGADELVIEQTGPDFMLDELERYMRVSAFSDLSIQCRDELYKNRSSRKTDSH